MRVHQLRGIQIDIADKMKGNGIKTTADLLAAGKTAEGRKGLAVKLGTDHKAVLELVNRADLARIKGIGEVYSNLLENAGVDTVLELSHRVPANLHAKLLEQTKSGDALRAPTLAQVEDWIKQAKELGRLVEY